MFFSIFVLLTVILFLFCVRFAIYLKNKLAVRKYNISTYPEFSQEYPTLSGTRGFFRLPRDKNDNGPAPKLNVSIVLGSGGHTSEMLALTKSFPREHISQLTYYVANTDTGSQYKAEQHEQHILAQYKHLQLQSPAHHMTYDTSHYHYNFTTIPRAREVGQSYFTSIYTTLYSLCHVIMLVYKNRPHILFVNGPGSCIPLCFAVMLFNLLWLSDTQIIFIESLTRVKDLSLSGKIMHLFADRFIVHWPQLKDKYHLCEYLGVLY